MAPRNKDKGAQRRRMMVGLAALDDMDRGNEAPEPTLKEESDEYLQPSIAAYLSAQASPSVGNSSAPEQVYSEDLDPALLEKAMNETSFIKSNLSNLTNRTPQQRAEIGAHIGGITGLSLSGPIGAAIGVGVGSVAVRALGMEQSGEMDKQRSRAEMLQTMSTLGVISDRGVASFDDSQFQVTMEPGYRLQNASPNLGEPDRGIFDFDETHPMIRRATTAALPIARFFTGNVLDWKEDNTRNKSALESATALFTNMMLQDADDISQVYTRAQALAEKMGVTEQAMRNYLAENHNKIPKEEAESLRKGVNILYGQL